MLDSVAVFFIVLALTLVLLALVLALVLWGLARAFPFFSSRSAR